MIFTEGFVPVSEAAKILKKDPVWIRQGIVNGWLPIGVATRDGLLITNSKEIDIDKGRINFYISPKKLYEFTGYVWKGQNNDNY